MPPAVVWAISVVPLGSVYHRTLTQTVKTQTWARPIDTVLELRIQCAHS